MEGASRSKKESRKDTPKGSRPGPRRLRVALLVNVISPYRIPVYNRLAERCDLTVLYSGSESNRAGWDAEMRELARFPFKRSLGWTFRIKKGRSQEGVFDYRHIHFNPGFLFDLVRLTPNAVITNELGARTAAAMLYGFIFRRPVWVWWGGTLHSERAPSRGQRIVRKLLMPRIRHWISYGQAATEYLLSRGVRIKSIVQIQNCVDSTQFGESVTPAFDYRPKPVLLHVGQYIGRKGLDELLESAARLRARGLEFTLVLIGRGPEEARLKERAASLGLRNVHFLPPRPSTEMPSVYRSADALIFPTKEDIWGLVVNEAILCGVPVLSSTHGGATQEIAPRENWFDPNDPEAFDVGMARAIEGKLKHANPRSLLTPGQVAERIFDDVARICALSTRSTPQ